MSQAVWWDDAHALPERAHVVVDINDDLNLDEEALFHLYNHVVSQQKTLLLVLPCSPGEMEIQLLDLRSRLRACPAYEVMPPDDVMVPQLLFRLLMMRQLVIKPHVLSYIVKRLERSYDAIHRVVQQLDIYSLEQKQPLTLAAVKQLVI